MGVLSSRYGKKEPLMYPRKKYFIDRDFQFPFMVRNAVYIFLSAAIIFGTIIGWNIYKFKQDYLMLTPSSDRLLEWAAKHHVAPDSVTFACQFIVQAKECTFVRLITKPLLIAVLVNALVSLLTSLYFSHRIAGPIFHIKKVIKAKLEGRETPPIRLRKSDYFYELAEMTNEALDLKEKEPMV